jgi:hypothetical protein
VITVLAISKIPQHSKIKVPKIPLLDRVFDLRRRIADLWKLDFFTLELMAFDRWLPDHATLSSLGFSNDMTVTVLETKRRVRLYFLDLNGRPRSIRFDSDVVLGSIADRFYKKQEFAVGFEYEKDPLSRLTPVFSRQWDPDRPITVILRDPRIVVQTDRGDVWLDDDSSTTTTQILQHLIPQYPKSKLLSLYFENREPPPVRIADLNPFLDVPFVLVVLEKKLQAHRMASFQFEVNGQRLPQSFVRGGLTVSLARVCFVTSLGVTSKFFIGFYFDDHLLSDDDLLLENCVYRVTAGDYRYFRVWLCPSEVEPVKQRFKRSIQYSLTLGGRVSDLVRHLGLSLPFLGGGAFSLHAGDRELRLGDYLSSVDDTKPIQIRFRSPTDNANYDFSERTQLGCMSQTLAVSQTQTVRDLKVILAKSRPRTLPEVIHMSFWSVWLGDSDFLISYGIPDLSSIEYRDRDCFFIKVRFGDDICEYNVSDYNTIFDLRAFIGSERGISPGDFEIRQNGAVCDDADFMADLPSADFEFADRIREFAILLNGHRVIVSLPCRATVGDAIRALDGDDLVITGGDGTVEPDELFLSEVVPPISCLVQSQLSPKKLLEFTFSERTATLEFDADARLSAVLSGVREAFGIPGTSTIELIGIDSNATACDLGPGAIAVRATKPKSVQIGLAMGTVPRIGNFSFAPGTTIASALEFVVAKWAISEPAEFVLEQSASGERSFPDPETLLDDIDLEAGDLTVEHARPPVVLVESVVARHVDEGSTFATCGYRPAPEEAGAIPYAFCCEERGDQFVIAFARGKTVKDARVEVGKRYGVEFGNVNLLFNGKVMKDAFLLDRLRIGKQKLNVHLKDMASVRLVTVAALRV